MAKSNRDRVSTVMDALKEGLGPFILQQYQIRHGARDFLTIVSNTLSTDRYDAPRYHDVKEAVRDIDTHGWLNLMWRNWNEVFRDKLGHSERSYVSEMLEARNDWAHQKVFTVDDAQRVADTATRLLEAVNAPKQADITREISNELMRLRFEREKERAKKKTGQLDEIPTSQHGLRAWRHVVQPHPDVAKGRYLLAEFVADIEQVRRGKASAEYREPLEFFRRTYLTHGLVNLLSTGIKRLSGQGGDPVIQLKTSFGGGKTHSMLAMYHLASGNIGLSEIPGGEAIQAQVGEIDDRLEGRRAVIVGTQFDANVPREHPDCTTRTMWGEIAYQLGGVEGYQMLEQADLSGIAPGADTLGQLFDRYGPALIIIDELVAFARNLYNVPQRPAAGSFDSMMTFMQSLTEAVKYTDDAILLISIPESDKEIGGEGGKAALEMLTKTIGRIESIWQPITAEESFEIVRRRLFSSDIDYAARDAVLSAYRDLYRNNSNEFPSGVAEGEYYRRMEAAYPIHPELFDRLYQDWSTLDSFQRTRGVLRLMANVIHELWLRNDHSLMIMPGSIPLDASKVRNEVLRYLPDIWHAVVDTDIDGDSATPPLIDNEIPTLGQHSASRRIARTVFMGSAPSVAEQGVRGQEEVRLKLGTVQPGEPTAVFGDALRRMGNSLTYLYTDGNRYWYDTRPTVNRTARDRAQNLHEDVVFEEQVRRLRGVPYSKEDFARVHIAPQESGDIADEMMARLVVIDPVNTHKRRTDSPALQAAQQILASKGTGPRLYRNMLVFVAADATGAAALEESIREYLAWKSIQNEEEELNLDAQQRKQVRTSLKRANEDVDLRLQEAYCWLLVPTQPNPTGDVQFEEHRIGGDNTFYERAAAKLSQSGYLIPRWSPVTLSMQLEKFYWDKYEHYSIAKLWEDLVSYPYFPRLFNRDVLLAAISDGVGDSNDPAFGYAAAVVDGEYRNFRYGEVGKIYADGQDVIINPQVAAELAEQLEEDEEPPITPDRQENGTDVSGGDAPDAPIPSLPKNRRYYGSVQINEQRINREIGVIVEEIVERLVADPNAEVNIRLEVTAQNREGFDDATVRTIKENSRTLKFDTYDFEDD
jgi:uncharacterized protein